MESKAEAKQMVDRAKRLAPEEAERLGNTLIDMVIVEEGAGLGGRVVLTLNKGKREPLLPWTRLDVGTPVILSAGRANKGVWLRGVMCQRNERQVQVAVNQLPDEAEVHSNWRIDQAQDEVAIRRCRAALEQTRTAHRDRLAELREVLLGHRAARFHPLQTPDILNSGLNSAQRDAVAFALSAQDVALIHGPPGTGKTTAVVEVIRQAVRQGAKVLACAPSNMGVDTLLQRLMASRTLDMLVERHGDVRVARKLANEAFRLRTQADKRTGYAQAENRRELRQEARSLLADARRLEAQAVESILNEADIICATTTGLDSEWLGECQFDLAVIDEACQSTEPGCWIPLLRSQRVVLAGDHCQLPPTIISREAAA